jgi:hypothetical protein
MDFTPERRRLALLPFFQKSKEPTMKKDSSNDHDS